MSTKTKKTTGTKAAAATKTSAAPTTTKEATPKTKESKPRRKAKTDTTATSEGYLTETEVAPATVATTDGTTTKPRRVRKAKADAEPAAGKTSMSQLDAAVKVLGEATEPLTTKQMVEAMTEKNLWTSPGGKTPHATLYSAILRELQTKADASRFVKTYRGHFQLRSA